MSDYVRSVTIHAKAYGAMTLGEVIDALRQTVDQPDASVNFAFGNLIPTHIASYRGSYNIPALGWGTREYWIGKGRHNGERTSPHALAARLEESIGITYTGWKGGEYKYARGHILCVDNPGESNGVVIEKIELIYDKKYAVLHTRKIANDDGYPHDIQDKISVALQN